MDKDDDLNKQPVIRVRAIESLGSTTERVSNVSPHQVADTINTKTVNNVAENAPVKLLNQIHAPDSKANDSLELIAIPNTNSKDQTVFSLTSNNINSTNNCSTLKIGQVFESVNDEFVEKLLIQNQSQSKNESDPKKEILIQVSTSPTSKQTISAKNTLKRGTIRFVPQTDQRCLDFRCNLCLTFTDTMYAYKDHMFSIHGFTIVCDICHEPFKTRQTYEEHRATCSSSNISASRPYICIVDPPVVLLKGNQVHAYKCHNCKLAFFNRKSYVQHAQRHSHQFRCKQCTNLKAMTALELRSHLSKFH